MNGTQPIVISTGGNWEFFWQTGGSVFRGGSSGSRSEIVATEANYPAALWNPHLQKTILAWESKDGIGIKVVDKKLRI
jgi:hypothetical protein